MSTTLKPWQKILFILVCLGCVIYLVFLFFAAEIVGIDGNYAPAFVGSNVLLLSPFLIALFSRKIWLKTLFIILSVCSIGIYATGFVMTGAFENNSTHQQAEQYLAVHDPSGLNKCLAHLADQYSPNEYYPNCFLPLYLEQVSPFQLFLNKVAIVIAYFLIAPILIPFGIFGAG